MAADAVTQRAARASSSRHRQLSDRVACRAANGRLRALIEERAGAAGLTVRVPRPNLCTDNGAMVAALGAEVVRRGLPPLALDLAADSSLPVTTIVA